MAQSLQLSQSLKTQLSPTQIMEIKMLELPITELQQRINEELVENPVLEIGEDKPEDDHLDSLENDYMQDDDCSDIFGERDEEFDPLNNEDFNYDSYIEDDEIPEYRYQTNNYSPDDEYEDTVVIAQTDFRDYLKEQVGQYPLTKDQQDIAEYVIGTLDDRGYLTRSIEQITDDICFTGRSVTDPEVEQIVELVRHLDPPGVGAKDLKECLLLQLKQRPSSPAVDLAITLIEKCFEEVAKHHYDRLQKRFNVTEAEIKAAVNVITSCHAAPSSAFGGDIYDQQRSQIIPDFRVETYNDEIIVSLCDQDIPPLCISADYSEMLTSLQSSTKKKTEADKEGIRFIKQKIDSAKWFIDAIRQRNETLMNTMKAIVEFQRDYFLEGDDCFLKPMILEDIAKRTGYDPSTISRVSNSKYVLTDYGIIPLKHFFSESLTTEDGYEVSTREVKKVLREIIDKEDKTHPLNDDKLVAILSEEGYKVARRTIAKYRDQLGIPVAGRRKQVKTEQDE